MKIVVFGLTVSSSWGNGHATLWRALIRALGARGHDVHFFERDVPYYAAHRDLYRLEGGWLHLYAAWETVLPLARRHLAGADVAILTSYCPDASGATELLLECRGTRVFYDMDSGVTLDRVALGLPVPWLGPRGYRDFDVVLSYTGGLALAGLRDLLGARRVEPLYGSVDANVYHPVPASVSYRSDLSYIGTFAADRQAKLEAFLIEPARLRPGNRFVIAGSQYPDRFPWTKNLFYVRHLPVSDHREFHCSARLELNVTRAAMATMGYCPSGRIFEAAACGVPLITDAWEGIEAFYQPGTEILVAESTGDVLAALDLGDAELTRIGSAARERTLAEHTAERRAIDFERAVAGPVRDATPAHEATAHTT
jgi:spore maturation protein CgeB